jgi:hypothetical protein
LNNTTLGYVIPLTSRYQVYQESIQPTGQARREKNARGQTMLPKPTRRDSGAPNST